MSRVGRDVGMATPWYWARSPDASEATALVDLSRGRLFPIACVISSIVKQLRLETIVPTDGR